ncbi:MAG: hypothetical protein ACOCV1_03440 [Bacillota bacterium]
MKVYKKNGKYNIENLTYNELDFIYHSLETEKEKFENELEQYSKGHYEYQKDKELNNHYENDYEEYEDLFRIISTLDIMIDKIYKIKNN